MRASVLLGALVAAAAAAAVYGQTPSAARPVPAESRAVDADLALVDEYCASCHDDDKKKGGFSFEAFDLAHPASECGTGGEDHPEASHRPDAPRRARASGPGGLAGVRLVAGESSSMPSRGRDPGRPLLHRLNRTEYRNAIRDLLDLDVDTAKLLPADNVTQGFDNMSEALTVTPTLMDAYASAAGKIARLAVGDPAASVTVDTYRLPTNFSQTRHVDGTPPGTRGGIAVLYNFPADAEYVFKASLVFTRNTFLFGSTIAGEQLEIAVDGERVALFDINPLMKGVDNNLETHAGQGRRPARTRFPPHSSTRTTVRSTTSCAGPSARSATTSSDRRRG